MWIRVEGLPTPVMFGPGRAHVDRVYVDGQERGFEVVSGPAPEPVEGPRVGTVRIEYTAGEPGREVTAYEEHIVRDPSWSTEPWTAADVDAMAKGFSRG